MFQTTGRLYADCYRLYGPMFDVTWLPWLGNTEDLMKRKQVELGAGTVDTTGQVRRARETLGRKLRVKH